MQRTDIATNLGDGFTVVKFTIAYSDLTAVATSQTISLPETAQPTFQTPSTTAPPNAANWVVPQAGALIYCKVHHTTAFAGTSITGMTASVGKLGGSNTFVAPAFNVFQAVADGNLQETWNISSAQISSWGVTVTFTATGANVNAATAGSVDLYFIYANISSPSE